MDILGKDIIYMISKYLDRYNIIFKFYTIKDLHN